MLKKLVIGAWVVFTLVMLAMAVTSEVMLAMAVTSEVSLLEKYVLISAVIIICLGPLAIARVNHRRAEQDSEN